MALFEEMCRTTMQMIVHWMRVGFVHGVMNTDNMSILGLTIDDGPCGWLKDYNPNWTPNNTDATGQQYRFGNQPQIAQWNLSQLANSLFPPIENFEPLQRGMELSARCFEDGWQSMMADKLGLRNFDSETDEDLIGEPLVVLQLVETDMTIFYRKLVLIDVKETEQASDVTGDALIEPLLDVYYLPAQLTAENRKRIADWVYSYRRRVCKDGIPDADRPARMNAVNPKYVLRNYLAQLAIDKAEAGDHSMVGELPEVLRHPYAEQPDKEEFV